MSTTVQVSGIASSTSEKEVRDFFSFCGKITNLEIKSDSEHDADSKSATVTFEKETAAKTALLLDNTQLGPSQVHVSSSGTASSATTSTNASHDDELAQEDKPRSRIIAEYLAHGYVISDNAINKAIALDKQHGFSNRFTSALAQFDDKYKATDKAKNIDSKYGLSERANSAWLGLGSYYEKATSTPTGQRLHQFYLQGDKQVRDVHNEARRLADLKAGKSTNSAEKGSGTDPSAVSEAKEAAGEQAADPTPNA